jgi:predicted nucleic acid-binding protein
MGFLRLATNPKANPLQTQTMGQAWQIYDQTMLDARIGFCPEPEGLESHWRQLSQPGTFSHKHWNDAYLAAFAQAGGYELVSFDKGFARYQGLTYTLLY